MACKDYVIIKILISFIANLQVPIVATTKWPVFIICLCILLILSVVAILTSLSKYDVKHCNLGTIICNTDFLLIIAAVES